MVAGSEINLNNLHDHGADGKAWYIGTTSQVLEPITQPRKTNTPRGPDFSDLAPNILGTIKQFVQGFADATLDNLSMGVLSPKPAQWTTSYKAGRLAGDVVGMAGGILGMAAGAGMAGGGTTVSVGSGGTLAIAGAPIAAEGVAVITASSALTAKSAAGFMADASHKISKEDNIANSVSGKNKVKTGNKKKSRSSGAMYGNPNTMVPNPDFIKTGKLDKYTVYGNDGIAMKEVRLTGKEHGDIPRPNIKDVVRNKNPNTGKVYLKWGEPRPPRPNEIENDLTRLKKELEWKEDIYIEDMEMK